MTPEEPTAGMTLAELIAAYRNGTSYERLARRAADAGHDISGAMLHVFATKPLANIPRVETIHAVSAALGVSPRRVLDAAAESVGLTTTHLQQNVTNRTQIEAVLAIVRHRPPKEIEHLSRVLSEVAQALDSRDP